MQTSATQSPDAPPLLDAHALRVDLPTSRGPLAVVRGVDLRIGRGETVGLIGESGCGKSMTALALMGLLPDGARVSGSIRFDGTELTGLDDAAMGRWRGRRLAMVFQEPMTALNPLHTIGAQVAEPMRLHRGLGRTAARAEVLRLLERVQFPQAARRLDAYPHELSGGQRQRVMIAAALAGGPDLLIADEATTALDTLVQREILDLLDGLVRGAGLALLLVSHDLALVAERVRRVMVMYAGEVVESGPTARVFERLSHPYTRALLASRPRLGHSAGRPRGRPLPTIRSRVPAPGELPPGCPFADRCDWAVDACRAAPPPVREVAPDHAVRCLRADEVGRTPVDVLPVEALPAGGVARGGAAGGGEAGDNAAGDPGPGRTAPPRPAPEPPR